MSHVYIIVPAIILLHSYLCVALTIFMLWYNY
jgi:hypothetical protein